MARKEDCTGGGNGCDEPGGDESSMFVKQIIPGIFRITVNAGPSTSNVFLIDRGIPTLIDTGSNDVNCVKEVMEGLAKAGRPIHQLRRILLTHIHWDHCGGAKKIRALAPEGKLLCFTRASALLENYEDEYERLVNSRKLTLEKAGVPGKAIAKMLAQMRFCFKLGENVRPDAVFEEGEELSLGEETLKVIPTPGHTPHCVSFCLSRRKILFSGDFIMAHMDPKPTIRGGEDGSFFPFRAYIQSIEKVQAHDIELILPSHGKEIRDAGKRISAIKESIHAGRESVLKSIREEQKSPFQIFSELNSGHETGQIYFGVAEVIAHLELFRLEGKVLKTETKGLDYYRQAGKGDS